MKILVATPIFSPEIGGPARYTEEIMKRLPKKFEVKILTFTQNSKVISISQAGVSIIRQVRLFLAVIKLARKVDLIYVLDPLVMGVVCLIVAKVLEKKIILRYGGDPTWETAFRTGKTSKLLVDFLNYPDAGLGSKLAVFLTGFVFRNVDKVVANCKFLKDVAVNQYKTNPNRVEVIYNAVDIVKNVKVYQKKKIYKILAFGRLVPWKNYGKIIEAVVLVNSHDKIKAELIICGDGPEKNKLEKLSKKLPFIKIINGTRSEVISLLGKADVYVLNSSFEGSPHQVLEAFSVGTPVVATDIPGTNEIAINNKTALTVRPGDIQDLADKIENVLSDPILAKKLANNGRDVLSKKFSWFLTIKQLESVFKSTVF